MAIGGSISPRHGWSDVPGETACAAVLPLAAVPFLLLPYDSITHLLQLNEAATSETLPVTALFSVVYLVMRGFVIRSSERTRCVIFQLMVSAGIMILVTLGNIAFEHMIIVEGDIELRFVVAVRQGVSLVFGLTTFLMFQDSFLRLGLSRAMVWVIRGSLPVLLVSFAQIGLGFYRVEGLSAEPSQFADYLVFALLPACFVVGTRSLPRLSAMLSGLIALAGTFSTTGFVKGGVAVLAYFASKGHLLRGLFFAVPALVFAIYVFFTYFPDNYAVTIIVFIWNAYQSTGNFVTASLIDRVFGIEGPLSLMGELHAWLGFGFGGDTVYFDRMFDPATAAIIRSVKGDIVAISTLQGKMLMYGGVTGYAVYLAAWITAWRGARRGSIAWIMLPAVFVATLFSLGPIFLPYVWFWLALAAAEEAHIHPLVEKALATSTGRQIPKRS